MDAQTIVSMVIAAAFGGATVWIITNRRRPNVSVSPLANLEAAPTESSPSLGASGFSVPTQSPVSLIIQNGQGECAIAVTELPLALFKNVSGKSRNPPEVMGRLNALLQAGPIGALAAQGLAENVFEVAINGPLLNAKDSAGKVIDGAYRAMTNGGNGGIKEHAVLTKPENL